MDPISTNTFYLLFYAVCAIPVPALHRRRVTLWKFYVYGRRNRAFRRH